MRKFLLGVLIGFLFAGLAAVIFVFALVRASTAPPRIPDAAILSFRLRGELPESPPIEIPLPAFEQRARPTVRDCWELLKEAAADRRIRGLVLLPMGLEAGWGKLQEIHDGLVEFRKSGKPVYAFLRAPGAREYYLATAADRIYIGPEDQLDLKGLRAEVMYLKKTLDKLGIQVEIEHAGKYKDAGDMFTRSSMSPETQQVLNSILDDLYGQLVGAIAAGRKQPAEAIRATIDQGPFISEQARAHGLVDGLLYQDQVFDELKQRLKLNELHRVSTRDYLRIPPESVGVETGRHIAFLAAQGDIIRGSAPDLAGEQFMGAGETTALLRRAGRDTDIKGVIVRIDSPGGDGFASDEIWREMVLLSKKKPLVISMSDTAASGGYYMAMTGDPILAYPGTFTGSIGVFYGKADLRGLYDKLGIQKALLTRGRFADIDSDYTPLSDAARKKLQGDLEEFYRRFVDKVAHARRRTYAEVDPVAQGRVWLGTQAKANGLVDALGGIDAAIEALKQKAHIPRDEKVRLVSYPQRRSLLDQIFSPPTETEALAPAWLRRLSVTNWAHGGIMRRMPYWLEVR